VPHPAPRSRDLEMRYGGKLPSRVRIPLAPDFLYRIRDIGDERKLRAPCRSARNSLFVGEGVQSYEGVPRGDRCRVSDRGREHTPTAFMGGSTA
jgi:hypothetical protein